MNKILKFFNKNQKSKKKVITINNTNNSLIKYSNNCLFNIYLQHS